MDTNLSTEFKAALARLVKANSGDEVEVAEIVGFEDNSYRTHGCSTCDYGGYTTHDVTVEYVSTDGGYHYFNWSKGNLSDLLNALLVA
jgi:hypothetical protein